MPLMACSPAKFASTIPCTNRCVASLMNTDSRFGESLQARCKIHGVAENRNACVRAALNLSNHCCPGIDANPYLRPHAVFGFEIGSGGLQTFA